MSLLLGLVGLYALAEFIYAVRKNNSDSYKKAGIAFLIFVLGSILLT